MKQYSRPGFVRGGFFMATSGTLPLAVTRHAPIFANQKNRKWK